jgi:hypothetical protein
MRCEGSGRAALWMPLSALAGGIVLGFCLLGCGLVIGIEEIEITGGGSGARGSGGNSGVGASGSVSSAGAGSSGSGEACGAAASACAQCANCLDVIDVYFDDYGTLLPLFGETSGASRSTVGPVTGCSQAAGPERIYAVHPKFAGFLTASLARPSTTFDSVLYARKGPACCATAETSLCADSSSGEPGGFKGGEVISFQVAKGDVWYIFVDGVDSANGAGSYELVLSHTRGTSCQDSLVKVPIELGSKMTLLGNTEASGDPGMSCGTCGSNSCAGSRGEVVYQLTAPPTVKTLEVKLDPKLTTFDSVLYARTTCAPEGAQLFCQDVHGAESDSGEKFRFDNPGVPFYLFVDTGPTAAQSYDYTLVVMPAN